MIQVMKAGLLTMSRRSNGSGAVTIKLVLSTVAMALAPSLGQAQQYSSWTCPSTFVSMTTTAFEIPKMIDGVIHRDQTATFGVSNWTRTTWDPSYQPYFATFKPTTAAVTVEDGVKWFWQDALVHGYCQQAHTQDADFYKIDWDNPRGYAGSPDREEEETSGDIWDQYANSGEGGYETCTMQVYYIGSHAVEVDFLSCDGHAPPDYYTMQSPSGTTDWFDRSRFAFPRLRPSASA